MHDIMIYGGNGIGTGINTHEGPACSWRYRMAYAPSAIKDCNYYYYFILTKKWQFSNAQRMPAKHNLYAAPAKSPCARNQVILFPAA